jgi:outer membrane protein assembly factor BamB
MIADWKGITMVTPRAVAVGIAVAGLVWGLLGAHRAVAAETSAADVLQQSGVTRGLCVVVNADAAGSAAAGDLAIGIARSAEAMVVHVLDASGSGAAAARAAAQKAGLAQRVSAEAYGEKKLPYPDNYVNLLIAAAGAVAEEEALRVLTPAGGVGYVGGGGPRVPPVSQMKKLTKPRPAGMDEWTHQRHAADGNPCSADSIDMTAVPDRLRWAGDNPRTWSHAMRAAGGRVFVVIGNTVTCRDAFNGVLLWKRTYESAGANSAPSAALNRPVAAAQRLFLHHRGGGIAVIDAASGEVVRLIERPARLLEFIHVGDGASETGRLLLRDANGVSCVEPAGGRELWRVEAPAAPNLVEGAMGGKRMPQGFVVPHLVADGAGARVYFITGQKKQTGEKKDPKGAAVPVFSWRARAVGLAVAGGKEVWRCEDEKLGETACVAMHVHGTLVGFNEGAFWGVPTNLRQGADGPADGNAGPWVLRARSWDREGKKLSSAAFTDLKRATTCLLEAGGMVWVRDDKGMYFGEGTPTERESKTRGWSGLDVRTGTLKRRVCYPIDIDWSGRCYSDVATGNTILSQTMEIVGINGSDLKHVRGIRGQCGIGFIVANNAVYTPPNQCIGCYPMVRGAISYETDKGPHVVVADDKRLERGPAYGKVGTGNPEPGAGRDPEWPMYRCNALRTGCTEGKAAAEGAAVRWQAALGARCTQPVVAGGRVFTAVANERRVVCLNAADGRELWDFTAGGRITTSPTAQGELCLFGSHDGYVYCLRASDGALAWRFNAAPEHRRIVFGEQVESPWPVFGSVLLYDGAVFATAGQYSALDGGLHFWALDPATGKARFHQVFAGIKGDKAVILPTHWYKHEDHAMNNILSGDKGRLRFYDEWGGWEFDARDGTMTQALGVVPQPGFPTGRISPGDPNTVERWPWAGFDRVSLAYLMYGLPFGLRQSLELDPRTRASGTAGHFMFFPDKQGPGIWLRAKGDATEVEPEPWVQPTDPKVIGFPKTFYADPRRVELKKDLWPTRSVAIRVQAFAMAGKETLWLAGTCPPPAPPATQPAVAPASGASSASEQSPAVAARSSPASAAPSPASEQSRAVPARSPSDGGPQPRSELICLSLKDGSQLGQWPFEGEATFDGLSIAGGRVYVATHEGKVYCFGK